MKLTVQYNAVQKAGMFCLFLACTALTAWNASLIRRYGSSSGYIVPGLLVFALCMVWTFAVLIHRLTFRLDIRDGRISCRNGFARYESSLEGLRGTEMQTDTRRVQYTPDSLFFRGGKGRVTLCFDTFQIRVNDRMEGFSQLCECLQNQFA